MMKSSRPKTFLIISKPIIIIKKRKTNCKSSRKILRKIKKKKNYLTKSLIKNKKK